MAAGEDAMIAQLMAMGFQPEAIEEYQVAMASSTEGFSMQAATEWLVNTALLNIQLPQGSCSLVPIHVPHTYA